MTVIGHRQQREALLGLFNSGAMPHALLFTGPQGIGKQLVAEELARLLLCESPAKTLGGCGGCESCVLIQHGGHPDLHRLQGRDKDASSAEAVRELLSGLALRSFRGGSRVVVLNDADWLSVTVANILLKVLEEPPARTYFILVAANPRRLPPTVLSRCRAVTFDHLSDTEMMAVLNSHPELAIEKRADAVQFLNGSLSDLDLVVTRADEWRELSEQLDRIHAGEVRLAIELSQVFGKDRDGLPARVRLLIGCARRRMFAATRSESKVKWANALANFVAMERLLFERHLNAGYVLSSALTSLVSDDRLPAFTTLSNSATLLNDLVY